MKIKLKMLGDLRVYLPVGAQFNRCELEMPVGATAQSVVNHVALPGKKAFLLMLNGDMLQAADYAGAVLKAEDEVVLFPPIKGG